jgi:hypothetical protein
MEQAVKLPVHPSSLASEPACDETLKPEECLRENKVIL